MTFILDGKGRGYQAEVDTDNRLRISGIQETTYDFAGIQGKSFNINTEFVSVTSSAETNLLYVQNNEATDIVIVGWFIGTGLASGSATEVGLVRVYPNPTGVSGGASAEVVNRKIGDGRIFNITATKQDSGSPLLATPPSTPVLYQTQTASSRVFGNVYLTLPRSQALLVTYEPNGVEPINIYTGFTGFISINGA